MKPNTRYILVSEPVRGFSRPETEVEVLPSSRISINIQRCNNLIKSISM